MSNRLVVHVPCITTLDNSLALSPSLASIESILPIVPQNLAILASSTAQEAVDLALAAYRSTSSHVVHLFDHFSSARELRKLSIPTSRAYPSKSSPSLQEALNNAGYALFDYCGSRSAVEVFVAVNGILANTIKNSLKGNGSTGIVTVRLLRPWDGPKFLATLPQSARHIHVLDDVASPIVEGPLYNEVLSTFCEHAENVPEVSSVRITPTELESYLATTSELQRLLSTAVPSLFSLEPSARPTVLKRVAFWSTSGTLMTPLPEQIAQPLLNTNAIHARFLSASDVFAKPGGATLSRLTLSVAPTASDSSLLDAPMDIVMPLSGVDQDGADFTAILDPSLLKSHDVLRASLPGSPVLIYTNWSLLELVENLHPANTALARERDLQMYTLDTSTFGKDESQRALAHAAFLRLYVGGGATFDTFERISRAVIGDPVSGVSGRRLVSSVWDGLQKVILPQPTDLNTAADRSDTRSRETPPLRHFEFNTISLTGFTETVAKSERQGPISVPWHEAAKHILFREAYSTDSAPDSCVPTLDALRPEQPIQTYLVTCAVNQRLTPESYNRNVFHMEFDTSGTGLTYELGEALGVHGWNDDGDVLEFCEWYGVNPDMLISIPLPATQGGSGNGKEKMKVTRTVFQALQQQIDIFGRPGKSFFAALAIYATNRREKMALQFIAAPEGTATLKKLGEKDTVSCADVLALYPSARPSIEELAVIVGEIKERHYSIASAQSVVGDRVDLLVVTVDWVTPSGTTKYGQCTRYLANLKPGSKVTVSIKPSVMKLPPSDLQPIIMAGLGTGAAPFRAFIQHRSLLKSRGFSVGPMVYYFGSRHRSQEYLYGEEIEAYIKDGILTHVGLAFSRDTNSKVYIQHKMRQDAQYLAGLIADATGGPETSGVFYLCGPTWPVPDVHEALVDALMKYAGKTTEMASLYIEKLKEEERYVLEVY